MRAIDADRLLKMMSHWKPYMDMDKVRKAVQNMPTLTPPNEPLTCEGCIHEEKEHQNCNYCMRASYLGDYYYRCPPEGEEDT